MKKLLVILLSLFLMCSVFGEGQAVQLLMMEFWKTMYEDGVYSLISWKGDDTIGPKDLEVDENGWLRVTKDTPVFHFVGKRPDDKPEYIKPYLVAGGGYALFFEPDMGKETSYMTSRMNIVESVGVPMFDGMTTNEAKQAMKQRNFDHFSVADGDVQDITATSFHSEYLGGKKVDYRAGSLNYIYEDNAGHATWVRLTPWVPGKERNEAGIGESLTVTFTEDKGSVVILNGYVDPFRRYLYKANNRLKTVVVESLDLENNFKIEYEFADFVHFAEITLPQMTDKVKITITEIYPGERWNDTCVTAVIAPYVLPDWLK